LAFANGEKVSQKTIVLDASNLMIKLYKANSNLDSAFYYQEVAMATKDSLYGREKFQQLQLLTLTQQQRQQQLREKQVQLQRIGFISALAVFLLIALLLWRNIRYQKRTNQTLNIKNEQIETQRNTLEKTLTELKGTQSQLIQSEKMASLGELTAGIAHEIQNPLNFVNNFSEVSTELLDEMIAELGKDNKEDALAIADDVKQNLEKILHHGKQADGIVKGMLQHSRSSSAVKEPTDINKLADEYLRLVFHGLRAKDKSFNAILKTDYDETIGNINIIPQDIGRVILNLITNAFYAVAEKKKQQPDGYEPTISISTKKIDSKVSISVKDNGNGIPPKVLDKIFQPFFTTKPTGQGTGLGLSLSYDIIKAHGGELKAETKEGEGSKFIIELPH
jgi:signal transduction histidine kinase